MLSQIVEEIRRELTEEDRYMDTDLRARDHSDAAWGHSLSMQDKRPHVTATNKSGGLDTTLRGKEVQRAHHLAAAAKHEKALLSIHHASVHALNDDPGKADKRIARHNKEMARHSAWVYAHKHWAANDPHANIDFDRAKKLHDVHREKMRKGNG